MKHLAIALLLACACIPDFDLESRIFLCDPSTGSSACAAGESCSNEGICLPDSGVADHETCDNGDDDDRDGKTDCQDEECGAASCNDNNPCTIDSCLESGACDRQNDNNMFGGGWICMNGRQVETSCEDFLDNEGDGSFDCLDADCPRCMNILNCCRGVCLPVVCQ